MPRRHLSAQLSRQTVAGHERGTPQGETHIAPTSSVVRRTARRTHQRACAKAQKGEAP